MVTHLLSLEDFLKDELVYFVERAIQLRRERNEGIAHRRQAGYMTGLTFEKPSTRTRILFEAPVYWIGGQVIFLSARDTQLDHSEPLKDLARARSRYVDAMVAPTFGQDVVNELAAHSSVPVINVPTDLHHN